MKTSLSVIAAMALALLATADASAQSMFSTGSNDMFGGRSSGTFNSGSMGLGQSRTGGGANTSLQQLNLQTLGESVFSANQFQVGSRNPGDFVGAGQDARSFVGAATTGQEFRRDTIGPAGNRSTANRPGAGRARTELRTSVRLGFTHTRRTAAKARESVADRIVRLGRLSMPTPLEVLIRNGTATLRGVVATERERILAEQMIRLEPGVWAVNNELALAAAPSPDETPRPATDAPN